jgi:ATP-dependent DNA helicase PIF1
VIHPTNKELYFLRLLLLYVKGATSFVHLRTVNGIVCESFEQAARERNLVADDREWTRCLQEAVQFQSSPQLRLLFSTICIYCGPASPQALWERFREHMIDDIKLNFPTITDNQAWNLALLIVQRLIVSMGSTLDSLNMQEPEMVASFFIDYVNNVTGNRVFNAADELSKCQEMYVKLNVAQKLVFDRVKHALELKESCRIYIHGPGGSGKTYLYTALCHLFRSRGQSVLATAWTGIAASLLQEGTTCHSRFGLPVPFDEKSTSRLKVQSRRAADIVNATVILGDEASMMPGCFIIELDRLLRDFTGSEVIFGNKIILLSGDMRQTLPVMPRRTDIEVRNQIDKLFF